MFFSIGIRALTAALANVLGDAQKGLYDVFRYLEFPAFRGHIVKDISHEFRKLQD